MSDAILIDGDLVMFLPLFGQAMVAVQPGELKATGPGTIGGKPIAIDGDEASVEVKACAYFTPVFSIPGVGTIKIKALAGDQLAQKTYSGAKLVMLKGGQCEAVFEVQTPAQQPPPPPGTAPPQPDKTKKYDGKGSFIPSNTKFMGT